MNTPAQKKSLEILLVMDPSMATEIGKLLRHIKLPPELPWIFDHEATIEYVGSAESGKAIIKDRREVFPLIIIEQSENDDCSWFEVAQAALIKSSFAKADTRIILIASLPNEEFKAAARTKGVTCVLEKPLTVETIQKTVAEALALRPVRPPQPFEYIPGYHGL